MKFTLNQSIFKLLHHQSYRSKFLNSEYNQMNLSDETILDLESIDKVQLNTSAELIAKKLLYGNHQGGQGLKSIFKETLSAWEMQSNKTCLDLIYNFLESEYFDRYHELPFIEKGISIEQAFYEFMKNCIWDSENPLEGIVRNEFLTNIFKFLTKTKNLNFDLDPNYFKKNSRCYYSVQTFKYKLVENKLITQPHFVLYAARDENFLSGEITDLIADFFYEENKSPMERMHEITKRHKISIQSFLSTYQQMHNMGLIGE